MKTRIASLALLALFVPMLTGCGKEPTAPTAAQTAPAPPPASSVKFDFSFFQRTGGAAMAAAHPNGVEESMSKSNWINAAVRVIYINLSVADLFTAPVQALDAALSTTPTLGDDGWYVWNYAFTDNGHHVSLRLRARIDGAVVTWQMYASDPQASPALDNFLWFTGESRLNNDRGFWVFNDRRDAKTVAVARIEWNNLSATSRSLIFRNVEAGGVDEGDQLEYRVDHSIVSVLFHDASAAQDADITWNETTGTGSLRVPDYNSGLRACWDERQENMTCPTEVQ